MCSTLLCTAQVVAPLSGYYSLSTDQLSLYDASSTIKLTPVESSYHDLSFTLTHVLPSLDLTGSPMFIRGGEPLGIFIPEPQTGNTDNEYYIHLEAHKTIGNETYTIDPTQFLLPIHDPQVALSYDCNDLVTYIGSTVVDRRKLAPDSPEVVPYGAVLVEDSIPGHEFQRPLDHRVQARGTILSGASVEVFSSSTALMVGPIPVQLGEYCVTLCHSNSSSASHCTRYYNVTHCNSLALYGHLVRLVVITLFWRSGVDAGA